uniref:Ig-like domain-containing protein n=1 Tax=Xiphophorus couchianus TaxID=32473 RepID=A0A3B5L9Y0_9TELE
MTNFTFLLPLLWTLSRVRLTLCRFHSVTVQAGGHVTLSCANLSNLPSHVSWSKLGDGGNIGYISTMTSSESRAVLCDEGQGDKYNMTSNGTDIFLDVQEVNLLDAGVYICGQSTDEFKGIFGVTYLQVEGNVSLHLLTVILGSVVVFLLVVIFGLILKVTTSHTGNLSLIDNLNSEAVSYSALNFRSKAKGDRRPAAERETDANVIYSATR